VSPGKNRLKFCQINNITTYYLETQGHFGLLGFIFFYVSKGSVLKANRGTFNALLLVAVALILGACASFHPVVPINVDIQKHQIVVSENKPTLGQKGARIDIPDTYFGVSSNKRGSLTAGLLLGPLGVAANGAYVESETRKMADRVPAIFDIDLSRILAEQEGYPIEGASASGSKIVLTPAARLYFGNDEGLEYSVICILNARVMNGSVEETSTNYSLWQQEKFSGQSDETKQRVARELQKCFADALPLMKAHMTDKLKSVGYEGKFKDPIMGWVDGNFVLVEDWLDKRLIARYSRFLVELSREDTKLIKKVPLNP
jgi:hypothetical protein